MIKRITFSIRTRIINAENRSFIQIGHIYIRRIFRADSICSVSIRCQLNLDRLLIYLKFKPSLFFGFNVQRVARVGCSIKNSDRISWLNWKLNPIITRIFHFADRGIIAIEIFKFKFACICKIRAPPAGFGSKSYRTLSASVINRVGYVLRVIIYRNAVLHFGKIEVYCRTNIQWSANCGSRTNSTAIRTISIAYVLIMTCSAPGLFAVAVFFILSRTKLPNGFRTRSLTIIMVIWIAVIARFNIWRNPNIIVSPIIVRFSSEQCSRRHIINTS